MPSIEAGMVQGIADDGVSFVEQGFEQSAVGIEAGAERIVSSVPKTC